MQIIIRALLVLTIPLMIGIGVILWVRAALYSTLFDDETAIDEADHIIETYMEFLSSRWD